MEEPGSKAAYNPVPALQRYLFYEGNQHAVPVAGVPSALEAFNQCVKVLAGPGMSEILSYYMTEYMTKQGFRFSRLRSDVQVQCCYLFVVRTGRTYVHPTTP